jgi:arsenate reductase
MTDDGARVELWHNPRCSKSRATLALLEARLAADDLAIIRYLESPPDEARLRAVLDALGTGAADFVRRGEAPFAELGLEDADEDALVAAMVEHPILIQRPVVITARGARVGRPPESVLDVLP